MNDNQSHIKITYATWSGDVMRATQCELRQKEPGAFVTGISSATLEKLYAANYGVFQAANWIITEEPQEITRAN